MKKVLFIILVSFLFFSCKDNENSDKSDDLSDDVVEIQDSIPEIIEEPKKKSMAEIKKDLESKGYKTFEYVDGATKDTFLMQQYYMAFLKKGPIRGQNEEESAQLQNDHLAHLSKMYELGYADISGPFGDDGDIRGVTIYNVPTIKMADSLANADPMVKAGRLIIEIHPWWAAKGFPLR